MFREMRRKDREKSPEEARRILRDAKNGTVSVMLENGYPYGVPISYVFEDDAIYFHSANAGQKYDALLQSPKVCFSVVGKDEPQPGKFATHYNSAIAFGTASLVEDEREINHVLRLIAPKYTPAASPESLQEYTQARVGKFCVFKIKIEHLTGKGNA